LLVYLAEAGALRGLQLLVQVVPAVQRSGEMEALQREMARARVLEARRQQTGMEKMGALQREMERARVLEQC